MVYVVVFVKQKTADVLRISDWGADVCSSDRARTGMASLQVSVHCSLPGGRRVVLGVPRQRGGPRTGAPVIQDPGNMYDLHGLQLLGAAQDHDVRAAERRVGKEGGSTSSTRWSPDTSKKKYSLG